MAPFHRDELQYFPESASLARRGDAGIVDYVEEPTGIRIGMETYNKKRRAGSIPLLLLIGLIMICLPLALASAAPIVWQNSSHPDPITPDDQWAGWRGLEKAGQVFFTPKCYPSRETGNAAASPVATGGRIFFCNTAGLTTVLAAERTYRKVSTADLSATVFSSFAAAGGQLFSRTENDLFCIAGER